MENKCDKCNNCWKHCDCVNDYCEKCQQKSSNQKLSEKLYTFTCDTCDKPKENQKMYRGRVNGIGIDPNKLCKICSDCIKWVDIIKPPKDEEFF